MPVKKKKRRKTKKKIKQLKKFDIKKFIKKNTVPIIAVVVALAVLIVCTVIGSSGRKLPNPLPNLNKDVALGVDVSSYNEDIDWQSLKDEVDFVIVRAGYTGYAKGNICLDDRLYDNLSGANDAGIPVGVYYYTQATTVKEAKEEARFVLHHIKRYDISLPVFIDYEYAQQNGEFVGRLYDASLSKDDAADIINAFCKVIEDAGYQSGVYASSSTYTTEIKTESILKSSYIWVADYNDKVTYKGDWDVWQYTEQGEMNSIGSRFVDMDYWYL